jgi:arginine vasopressin receptor 1A
MVGISWSLSLLFSIPQFFIFAYRKLPCGHDIYDCWAVFDPLWLMELYITYFTVTVYIIPTSILVFCYGCICYTVWKRGKVGEQMSSGNRSTGSGSESGGTTHNGVSAASNAHDRSIWNAKVKTIKLTMTVVTCYLICWSPFFVTQMWATYDEKAPFTSTFYIWFYILTHTHTHKQTHARARALTHTNIHTIIYCILC